MKDEDCASDNVSCTVETCSNHLCTHVATDSKCMPSGDVCKPNKCDAAADCKQVDISVAKTLMNASSTLGNGSFELSGAPDTGAAGWAEIGTFKMIYNCTGAGCAATNGTTFTMAGDGNWVAWLGGTTTASITGLDHLIHLPAGAVKLQIMADQNFQTKSVATANKDVFEVQLQDATQVQIGAALLHATNANAQTNSAHAWTANGINVTTDVSAHADEDVHIVLWSSVDATLPTDFFIDNVRITATVCQ